MTVRRRDVAEAQRWLGVCQCLVLAAVSRVVVATDGNTTSPPATCIDTCREVSRYTEDLNQQTEVQAVDLFQICLARQQGFLTFKCVLSHPGTCESEIVMFQEAYTSCENIGVDLFEAPIEKKYRMSTCKLCLKPEGSSDAKVWVGKTLRSCKADCTADDSCAAFDFDASRSLCRMWHSCPASARSRSECQWTIYDKLGFTAPAPDPSTGVENATAPAGNMPIFNMTLRNATCNETCTEMDGFLKDMNRTLEAEDLDPAQTCIARQVGFLTYRCVLDKDHKDSCWDEFDGFQEQFTGCARIGINLREPAIPSKYHMSTCKICSKYAGASRAKVEFGKNLHSCEVECDADEQCGVFDFDASRGLCRTWHSCEGAARRGTPDRCQWTVYDKPGFVSPKLEPLIDRRAPTTGRSTTTSLGPDCKGCVVVAAVSASTQPLSPQFAIVASLVLLSIPTFSCRS